MGKTYYWVEYAETWRNAPLAYWVHIEQDGEMWPGSRQFLPPAPIPIPHKGYPVLCIEFEDTVLRFTSEPQMREFVRVLEQVPLPTTRRLSLERCNNYGPNSHWLSRLPAKLKSPKVRARLVEMMREALASQRLFPSAM
jgi:hypothetical protein